MHEEYLPGYDWEDLFEDDIEKVIPLDDDDDQSKDPSSPPRRKELDDQ